jgi:hypothetical protein
VLDNLFLDPLKNKIKKIRKRRGKKYDVHTYFHQTRNEVNFSFRIQLQTITERLLIAQSEKKVKATKQ